MTQGMKATVVVPINMTAVPSRTGHIGILSCRTLKQTFQVKRQYYTPQIRLIVQSFSKRLFDILECHYSRMKDFAANTARTKVQTTSP
jgi:hypothetical protein